MQLDKIKEIIKKGKAFAKSEVCLQVAENFEEFIALYEMKEQAQAQGDIEYIRKLVAAQKKFWESYEKAAESLGFRVEDLRTYFENPNNFSPQQWQSLETLKQQLTAKKNEVTKSKNHRKNQVRI